MGQIQVISGVERRRRWSEEQKRAIVAAAFAPDAVVTEVARRADVCPNQIYRWRRDLRAASAGFVPVIVAGSVPTDAVIEVSAGGGAHARIPASTPPALAAAVVTALVRR